MTPRAGMPVIAYSSQKGAIMLDVKSGRDEITHERMIHGLPTASEQPHARKD